jgi:hypothetical protein
MTKTTQNELLNALKKNGWYFQRNDPATSGQQYANLFGQNWHHDEIKEHPNGKRLRETCNAIDLHTDPACVKLLIMECKQAATIGGEVTLLDADILLKSLNPKAVSLLREVESLSPSLWKNNSPTFPILNTSKNGELRQCYFAPWFVIEPQLPQLKQVFHEFLATLNHATPIEVKMSKGDILIVDNHRILHGRRAFLRNSGRWFNRYWIPDDPKNILFDKGI